MRELALHLLDVARNSIEAGATALELVVSEDRAADCLSFSLRDNGCGMDATTLARATDPFFTTRTTRRQGLGLSLMQMACEHAGGAMEMWSEPGEGTYLCGTMKLSHLDRPPIGDMGGVIQALACEGSRVSLRYRHIVDGRMFIVDTSRLMCPLGSGRLDDPAVLHWLKQMVNAELVALHRE